MAIWFFVCLLFADLATGDSRNNTILFISSKWINVTHGLIPLVGSPQLLSVYADPTSYVGWGYPSVFSAKLNDGQEGYRMIYQGWFDNQVTTKLALLAESLDAVNWKPAATGGSPAPNTLFNLEGQELSQVFDDSLYASNVSQRLKMLLTNETVLVSSDGTRFELWPDIKWTTKYIDPGFFAFRRPDVGDIVITCRPQILRPIGRHIGIHNGSNWTDLDHNTTQCFPVDRIYQQWDQPYGMPVFYYEGLYIGYLWRYWLTHATVSSALTFSDDGWSFTPFNNGIQSSSLGQNLTSYMDQVDLPGGDYERIYKTWPNATVGAQACQTACTANASCVAWTYVRPGTDNGPERCCLKDQISIGPRTNVDVISGVTTPEDYIFLPDLFPNNDGTPTAGQVYPCTLLRDPSQPRLLIHASASTHEHGTVDTGYSSLLTYALRLDGFVYMAVDPGIPTESSPFDPRRSEGAAAGGMLLTKLLDWGGGELYVNAVASSADNSSIAFQIVDVNGDAIDGYEWSVAVAMTVDALDWVPTWTSGRTMSDLAGTSLMIEVAIVGSAQLYAMRGSFVLSGE